MTLIEELATLPINLLQFLNALLNMTQVITRIQPDEMAAYLISFLGLIKMFYEAMTPEMLRDLIININKLLALLAANPNLLLQLLSFLSFLKAS